MRVNKHGCLYVCSILTVSRSGWEFLVSPTQYAQSSYSRLTAREGILLGCPSMVRYFYAPTLLHWVMVEVDIRALVEAVVRRFVRGRREVVMDVCEAVRD